VTAHLHSAATTFEQILGELHPEYDWIVTMKGCGRDRCVAFADPDPVRPASTLPGDQQAGQPDPS
jgi:hypothetical protein